MPRTTNRKLTLTKVGKDIKLEVTYKAIFSTFERNLAGLGLVFREQITVFGVDPPGSTTGTDLFSINGAFLVTGGSQEQVIERRHVVDNVSRAFLDEDPGTITSDDDEIRCRIRILPLGFPPAFTDAFTNQVVLFEDEGTHS